MRNLSSFKKLGSLSPAALIRERSDSDRVLVLIKLNRDARLPGYVERIGEYSDVLFSAAITIGELERLEADPAVKSFSVSEALPLV